MATSPQKSKLSGNSQTAETFLKEVDARIMGAVQELEATQMWKTFLSPTTDMQLLRAIIRELSLEIYSYQPQVTEAVFTTVGRMPKTDPKMIKTMLIHQADEADHAEMALKDYIALGGDEAFARNWRMTVPSFAFASLWWGVAKMANPFAYLGMMYPFESITPFACQKAVETLCPVPLKCPRL